MKIWLGNNLGAVRVPITADIKQRAEELAEKIPILDTSVKEDGSGRLDGCIGEICFLDNIIGMVTAPDSLRKDGDLLWFRQLCEAKTILRHVPPDWDYAANVKLTSAVHQRPDLWLFASLENYEYCWLMGWMIHQSFDTPPWEFHTKGELNARGVPYPCDCYERRYSTLNRFLRHQLRNPELQILE